MHTDPCDTLHSRAAHGIALHRRAPTNRVPRVLTLTSHEHYGRRPPPASVGRVLELVDAQLDRAVSMAFRGRSSGPGPKPAWLTRITDVRFLGLDGDDETRLHFEAPQLGEASDVYTQAELWPTRPDAKWTAFEVLADVVRDVAAHNEDSDRYDGSLLRGFERFGRVLGNGFSEARIEDKRARASAFAVVDEKVVEAARVLGDELPTPRTVRIVGKLDMIRDSTQSFALLLDEGEEVRGTLVSGDLAGAAALFKKRALVQGKAIYRPSGKLLRVDAESIQSGDGQTKLWSRIPAPVERASRAKSHRRPQTSTTGVNAFFGRWPGDETDEELLRAIEKLG